MKLKVKAALIDLDGTIVDSREAYREALRKTCKAFGLKKFDEAVVLEIPRRLEQNMPINALIPEVDVEKFLDKYLTAYYESTGSKTRLFPNVSKTLEEVSKKLKLALVTMRRVPVEKAEKELEKFGIAKYFHCVVTALDTPFPKPSPKALLRCAEKLRVGIGECIVVGDSVTDVKAGRNAGAKTVAVLSGIFSRQELEREKPDLIIKDVNGLPEVLVNL
ncbi:MAG: HAD family hydrolase [Candidatus Bathyarchaeia archaeon]